MSTLQRIKNIATDKKSIRQHTVLAHRCVARLSTIQPQTIPNRLDTISHIPSPTIGSSQCSHSQIGPTAEMPTVATTISAMTPTASAIRRTNFAALCLGHAESNTFMTYRILLLHNFHRTSTLLSIIFSVLSR